jgi:FecR protein
MALALQSSNASETMSSGLSNRGRQAMKPKIGRLAAVLISGAFFFAMSAATGAQDGPPDSQQPMEIPPQYEGPAGAAQAPAQQAQNESGAGRISFVHGDVSTQHSDSSDWTAATLNTPVVNGDHISTGPDSRVEIQLDYANVLRLSDKSEANVVSMSRNQMQLQIGQGLATYNVLRNNEANIEIDTPNVAVRPAKGEGSFRIEVNSDGETIVDVRQGSAEISTPQGSTRVERDQRIMIQGSGDNAQYQISGAPGRDDWDHWNADRDHAIEGAQSWKKTNPYYTGTQDLDSYGQWRNVPDYGQVWFPAADSGWVPYRDGRWVWEPYYGWTWVSYEPWGWAPYHYGRWFVYGGGWGWWPGPVYASYYPLWAPAYVSFFGFGGGGFGLGIGFGFGNVGWLPCGPGDRFFPWYGRGVTHVNVVNVYNIHNERGGLEPLRRGPGAFSNIERASSDGRVRAGFSSMESGQFGRGRVPMRQTGIEASTFRQTRMMTGANPVTPSRQSFQSTDRQANPRSIPSRPLNNQRFFNSNNVRVTGPAQAAGGNRGPSATPNPAQSNTRGFAPGNPGNVNRGPSSSEPRQPVQSSRPGWRTFTPPSGSPPANRQMQSNSGRTFEGQSGSQVRPNVPTNPGRTFEQQGSPQMRPSPSQPAQPPRQNQNQNGPRGNFGGYGSNRPTLDMHQPVVTPRGGGAPPARGGFSGNNGGGYHPAPPSGGPRGGSSGAPSHAGNSGGGSHGGGSSGGGHNHH